MIEVMEGKRRLHSVRKKVEQMGHGAAPCSAPGLWTAALEEPRNGGAEQSGAEPVSLFFVSWHRRGHSQAAVQAKSEILVFRVILYFKSYLLIFCTTTFIICSYARYKGSYGSLRCPGMVVKITNDVIFSIMNCDELKH